MPFGLPLAFTVPFALLVLAALPAIFILLRITPPRPQRVPFPPLRLILDLRPRDETPAKTPWWLLLLRLLLAALVIVAMAGPIWNPVAVGTGGAGPLLIAIDDSWAAAPSWDLRVTAAAQRIEAARQGSRTVALVAMSDGGKTVIPMAAATALDRLRALRPVPWTPDRAPAAGAIAAFVAQAPKTSIVWIIDGLERGGARAFAGTLAALKTEVTVVGDAAPVGALLDPRNDGDGLVVRVLRSKAGAVEHGSVRALDKKGLAVGEAPFILPSGKTAASARFDLPIELRNEIARLEVVASRSAGEVTLLDSRWRRRSVGIVSGASADLDQPLLSPEYYLRKALSPFSDVHEPKPGAVDPIGDMLNDKVSVLVLADFGAVTGPLRERLGKWVDEGGLLVRFAGTRLAAATGDFVPVKLRQGGRVLGGSLSWEQPKHLAPFEPPSPFVGLTVPKEVTVTRQVLAEPEPGLPGKTWAQLSDGTPLVTAAARGKGRVVLFHVTGDTTWSNLPLSGLFVDMLKRVVALSGDSQRAVANAEATAAEHQAEARVGAASVATLPPTRILDGFGVLGAPPPTAKPLPVTFEGIGSADHPPGFYGPSDSLLAVNVLSPTDTIPEADLSGLGLGSAPLKAAEPIDLRPGLVAAAFVLFLVDAVAAMWLGGKLRWRPRRAAMVGASLLLGALLLVPRGTESAFAQATPPLMTAPSATASVPTRPAPPITVSPQDLASALTVRLAFVASGDPQVDETARQGLASLSTTLAARTSLTPGDPIGLDPAKDQLAFYPLIYWPVVGSNPQPSQAAIDKIAAYMRQGGTVVFDTRDALQARPSGEPTENNAWLRTLLAGVDLPELEPIPVDHVVTKTFYLIDNFIGRYASGRTWIEALPPPIGDMSNRPARAGDGVSPIVITSNDLAAGWAGDEYGEAIYPLVPGDPRQHELSLRGGVNLVMYTLTGNYKADQVHVRDLLERLGH